MSEEIKPCPFCGKDGYTWPAYDEGWWAVGCANDDCEVQCYTPSCSSIESAIELWNHRA